jgi:hypothetical protein
LGVDERAHLIEDLEDHSGRASGGQRVNVFLDDGRTGWINSGLAPLAPVSIGVKQSLRTWKPALCVVRAVVSKRGFLVGTKEVGAFSNPHKKFIFIIACSMKKNKSREKKPRASNVLRGEANIRLGPSVFHSGELLGPGQDSPLTSPGKHP